MPESSVIEVSTFFSKATQKSITTAAGLQINGSHYYQRIAHIMIAGYIGSFVSFKGDYNVIFIMNFSGDAAVEIVSAYLKTMGMPEKDIPKDHTSEDIRNNIGEIVNQIIGKCRQLIQKRYDLSSKANIPAVVPVTTPIGLTFESAHTECQECVRISMSTPSSKRFYIELSMESSQLVDIKS